MSDNLTKLVLLSTAGVGIPTLSLALAKRYSEQNKAKKEIGNSAMVGGLAGGLTGSLANAVEVPGESSNLKQLARILMGGAAGAGLGAATSYAQNHEKLSSLKDNKMATFAELITKMAADYKATNAPGIKQASSDEEIKAFAVGVAKFASDADLDEKEFDEFHSACVQVFKNLK